MKAILVTILGTLVAANLPILAYAWLYMQVPNLVAGVLYFSYWHQEKRSRSSGGSTTRYTKHYQVVPVVSPGWKPDQAPEVWLTSEADSAAFEKEPEKLETLSALKRVKPERGFYRAVAKACEKVRVPQPQDPLLLVQARPFQEELKARQRRLLNWLAPYNVLLLMLTLISTTRETT